MRHVIERPAADEAAHYRFYIDQLTHHLTRLRRRGVVRTTRSWNITGA